MCTRVNREVRIIHHFRSEEGVSPCQRWHRFSALFFSSMDRSICSHVNLCPTLPPLIQDQFILEFLSSEVSPPPSPEHPKVKHVHSVKHVYPIAFRSHVIATLATCSVLLIGCARSVGVSLYIWWLMEILKAQDHQHAYTLCTVNCTPKPKCNMLRKRAGLFSVNALAYNRVNASRFVYFWCCERYCRIWFSIQEKGWCTFRYGFVPSRESLVP